MAFLSHISSCVLLLLPLLLSGTTNAATLEEWRRRTIYQVLTDRFARSDGSTTAACNVVSGRYCGGSWAGITDKLDYIQGMHFDAIWISPVVAQLKQRTGDGEAYAAYWAQDLYSLNSNCGSEDDLHRLIDAAHRRGMFVMLDVVVNHMGYAGKPSEVNYSIFKPFNNKKYFHNYCAIDSSPNRTQLEVCWLGDTVVALADLRTEDREVRDMYGEWISFMVGEYAFDGLRIDTALNVEPGFFPTFVEAAGVFATAETMQSSNKFVCPWAETVGSILNYPIYYPLIRAFANAAGNINDLVTTIYTMRDNCADPTGFGTFSENHDVPRFTESTNDTSLVKNVITFTIMADGIPIIYQGQEQHMSGDVSPPINRAPLWTTGYDTQSFLYKHIATLNLARQHFITTDNSYTTYPTEVIYQDYHTFAMRKGSSDQHAITVLNNNGRATQDFEIDIHGSRLRPGTVMMEVFSCTNLTVNRFGQLTVPMGSGLPKVLYPANFMSNSGLCGMGDPQPKPSITVIATMVETVIGGHSTMVRTSTTLSPTGEITSSSPTHTHLALGSATQDHIGVTTPILVAALSVLLGIVGAGIVCVQC